ncbi:MAG: methionine gamma-lyase family protein, partial [Clostridia bacterium]|nr:methionine gamma-lyase family protein [Clostridia bacterium]
NMYMGFFNAPSVTANALKTAVFAASLFENLGFEVSPRSDESRHDIIQTVILKSPEALCKFCEGIQASSPIDSFVTPEPWDMPGYSDKVIMAAGAFISGASIELSADGPLREPYAAWMQGGITFSSGKTAVMMAAQKLEEAGII